MSADIETADSEDVDTIVEMWLSLAEGQRSYGSHIRADANRQQIRDAITRHVVVGGLHVARCPDAASSPTIVGFVMFGLETGTYAQDVTRGIVRNIYVDPSYRGDGIGSALLSAAEQSLADAGADVVSLEAMADNRRAQSLYEDRGYQPHRVEFEKPLEENDTHTKEG